MRAVNSDDDVRPVGADDGAGGVPRPAGFGAGLDDDHVAAYGCGKLVDGQPVLDAHNPVPSTLDYTEGCAGVYAKRAGKRPRLLSEVGEREVTTPRHPNPSSHSRHAV
jgi:hypothetical protein